VDIFHIVWECTLEAHGKYLTSKEEEMKSENEGGGQNDIRRRGRTQRR
jgi:hypothetical protein